MTDSRHFAQTHQEQLINETPDEDVLKNFTYALSTLVPSFANVNKRRMSVNDAKNHLRRSTQLIREKVESNGLRGHLLFRQILENKSYREAFRKLKQEYPDMIRCVEVMLVCLRQKERQMVRAEIWRRPKKGVGGTQNLAQHNFG